MAGPWEKYAPQSEQSGPWSKYGAAPPAATPPEPEKPGYLSQVGTGLLNAAKGLSQFGAEAGGVATDPLNAVEHLRNLKKMVLDPQVDQAITAADRWKSGDRSEAVGHALAAILPGVGPAAANIGDKAGSGDFTGAAADATVLGATMAAPKVVPQVAKAGGAVADAAKGAAGKMVDVATSPAARDVAGVVSPRLSHALSLASRMRKAIDAFGDKPPAEAVPIGPGEALAKAQGIDYAKLSAEDRGMLDLAAKGQQNAAAQPTARQPMAPQPAPAPAAAPGKTVADLLREEMAAKRAAAPPPESEVIQPKPAAPTEAGSKPMSNAQAQAAMARKAPPPMEPAGRSGYTASGEVKSSDLRAMEKVNGNIEAKAQRFAEAFHQEGIAAEDVRNMTPSDARIMTDGLIAKGLLKPGEMPPQQSMPLLIKHLKKLESGKKLDSAKIAADLKAEMERSGTLSKQQ